MVPPRTRRRYLWLWTGTEVVQVYRRRLKLLRDAGNEVFSMDSKHRWHIQRRNLFRSAEEAEREIAVRVLSR